MIFLIVIINVQYPLLADILMVMMLVMMLMVLKMVKVVVMLILIMMMYLQILFMLLLWYWKTEILFKNEPQILDSLLKNLNPDSS